MTHPTTPLRVLVADDHFESLMLVELLLRREGLEVQTAAHGEEALDLLRAARAAGRPYDLAILDIMMPFLDGREVVKMIRDEGDPTPCVYLTAHHSSSYGDGVERWRKPYIFDDPRALVNEIKRKVEESRRV